MLKAIEIGKDYGDKIALNDVSLTFPDRGLVIIKGESGSGKTTLLNLLTAHDHPTSGVIQFDGVEINAKNSESYRKVYCSNIYQDYMLIEDMSVSENIELALQAYGESYSADTIKQLLQKVGIPEEYMSKQASKLSGGEKQRVSIARAIAKDDAMIFADEPTGNLDIKNGEMIMDLLKDISKDRLVVAVSHNEGFNEKYADYSVELVDGAVESCDLPSGEGQVEDKEQTEGFKKISKLKVKTLFKFAFGGIKRKKVKTAVSVVAFVMLCMLSLLFMVAAISDVNLAYTYSLDKCIGKNFIAIGVRRNELTLDDLNKFKNTLRYGCSEIFSFNLGNGYETDKQEIAEFYEKYQKPPEKITDSLYLPYIDSCIVYNTEIGVDVEVLHGDFPKNLKDIMLPYCYVKYMAKVYNDFKTDDVKDLIGKEIKVSRSRNYVDTGTNDSTEYYTFRICGIFEEGPYFTDLDKQNNKLTKYYYETNMLAKCAILASQIKELWLNECEIIDSPRVSINDREFYYYGYSSLNDYAYNYAPLEDGEIYIDMTFAQLRNINVGDRLTNTKIKGDNSHNNKEYGDFDGLVVKDIIDLPDRKNFVIFSSQYYMENFIKGFNIRNDSFKGFYFNMRKVNDVHGFINQIAAKGSNYRLWGREVITNNIDYVYTENINVTTRLHGEISQYKYFVFIPLAIISLAGLVAMGFVVTGYLIASKGNSYTILRSLGFGKGNIALTIAVQVLSLILMGCIVGVSMGALGCHLFGKAYIKSQLGTAVAKIATEVVLPMGYAAPLLVVGVSIALGVAVTLIKTRSLFKKSVIEIKTS